MHLDLFPQIDNLSLFLFLLTLRDLTIFRLTEALGVLVENLWHLILGPKRLRMLVEAIMKTLLVIVDLTNCLFYHVHDSSGLNIMLIQIF